MITFRRVQVGREAFLSEADVPSDSTAICFDPEYVHPVVWTFGWGGRQVLIRAEERPHFGVLIIDLESRLLVAADRQVREIYQSLSHKLIWESTTPIWFSEVSFEGGYVCIASDIDLAVINLNDSTIDAQGQYFEVISNISLSPNRVVVQLIDGSEQDLPIARA